MLNRIFSSILGVVFFLVVSITFTACEKEKDTVGVIIVKDMNNNTIKAASVTLHQDGQISDQGEHTNPALHRTEKTDVNGRAEFIYVLEAVLDIEVVKYDGNDTLTGSNVIVLQRGKIVTKVVEIN